MAAPPGRESSLTDHPKPFHNSVHNVRRSDGFEYKGMMILPEVAHGTGGTDTTASTAPGARNPVVDVPTGAL
jgi:hypothetical protein